MIDFLLGLFRPKTVDSICASFHKTVDDLTRLAQCNCELGLSKRIEAELLMVEVNHLAVEADRAGDVVVKIQKLIG